MVKQNVHRFDIWLVQLDPAQGSEIRKTRPCAVISPDEMLSLKTAIVAPMTSEGFSFPTRIQCFFQEKSRKEYPAKVSQASSFCPVPVN
ncbi:MAG: type II toxin-antitoxin system PemK/MazF family toxin [Desulfococcaceae bacterium]